MSKEDQRREYNEQKELENLRRVFEAIDKNRDSKLDAKELNAVLVKLGYTAKKQEIEDMIWEVDEDVRVMCFGKHCVARALRPVATLYA